MLRLADSWIWDFWFARDGADYHVFYLKAPRSLGDPAKRHWHARIGHAVSSDLRAWTELPDALGPGDPGAFDDLATWTGSVFSHAGRHHLYYTGIARHDGGAVQRIGLATSGDLVTWERARGGAPVLEADGRWYERLDRDVWHEEAWRDPWVYRDPASGDFRMLLSARVRTGSPDGRGVVGQARSSDLETWEALPPATAPGDFAHMECPQLVAIAGRHYLLFSAYEWAHSHARSQRLQRVCGTHYLVGHSATGPFAALEDDVLCASPAGPVYAGKLIEDPGGRWVFLAFEQYDEQRRFRGQLADPVPVEVLDDGRLRLVPVRA